MAGGGCQRSPWWKPLIYVKETRKYRPDNISMSLSQARGLMFRAWLLLAAGALALSLGAAAADADLGGGPADYPAFSAASDSAAGVPAKAPCGHVGGHQSHASCVSASCAFDTSIAGANVPPMETRGIGLRPQEAQFLRGVGAAPPFHPPRLSIGA